MIRMLFTYALPLILPTVMFFIWTAWARKRIDVNHISPEEAYRIKTPWFRLILAGVGLMVVGLLLSVLLSPKNPPKSTYQAPRIENGKIVPGQYAPK